MTEQKHTTIDCTPTWAAILPILLLALEEGGETGKRAAREEITRMAAIADLHVASQKKGA